MRPFGVERSRRISESDIAERPYVGTRWRNPRALPSPSRATTTTLSGCAATSSESMAIAKPRSGSPCRHSAEIRSSSAISSAVSSRNSSIVAVKPAFSRRLIDWRTFLIARPSSEKSAVSTIASSPR